MFVLLIATSKIKINSPDKNEKMRNKVKMVDMKTKITFYNVEKEKINFF